MAFLDRLRGRKSAPAAPQPSPEEALVEHRQAAERAEAAKNPRFYQPLPPELASGAAFGRPVRKILFVCTGNICRSATGAVAAGDTMRRLYNSNDPRFTGHWIIESAGTNAVVGHPMDETIRNIALERGVRGTEFHVGKQLTFDMIMAADLIFVFDQGHYQWIQREVPTALEKIIPLKKAYEIIASNGAMPLDALKHLNKSIPTAPQHWMADPYRQDLALNVATVDTILAKMETLTTGIQ